jgi:hypothetical protein
MSPFASSASPAPTRPASILAQGLRKTLAVLALLIEVWGEARALQRAAHSRYPFADW